MGEKTLYPVIKADPLIEDAVRRAFNDHAARYFEKAGDDLAENLSLREQLFRDINDLGFCDALEEINNTDAWPDAAAIIRAQAYSGAPLDMVEVLIRKDHVAAIAHEAGSYLARPIGKSTDNPDDAQVLTALSRCLQINAAMEAAIDTSLQYVQDRKQFGRPLSAFQAIQHSLATAAEEVAAATAATDLALGCLVTSGAGKRLNSLLQAAALVNCSAVTVVFQISHQVHGAIGFTREYSLHRHTLNLLAWRNDLLTILGSEIKMAESLGKQALQPGGVWTTVTRLMGSTE